ncbi:MAG: M56 family metallopeptidase [Candidatus Shapirobacteria bacterium]|nr:M56 family metallopeptidase [Candidatus Shapirobacteria bacterium]
MTLFKILLVTILLTFIKTVLDFIKIASIQRTLIPIKNQPPKLYKIGKSLGLNSRLRAVKHQQPFAFCFGFLKPRIIVSDKLIKILNEKELKTVLCHEKYHLDHKDALTMFITRLLLSLFPFFPLLNDQINHFSLDREIKADREAMLNLGESQPLINTLKKLLSYEITPAYATFPSFTDSENKMEIRIKAIIQKETKYPRYHLRNILISAGAFISLIGLMFLPLNMVNVKAVNDKEGEVVVCLNDESCILACQQEKQGDDLLFHQLHPSLTGQNIHLPH